jgi:hypothetical protein
MFVNGIHFQQHAKLEYGRVLWRRPESRERLLRHWRDPRAERFAAREPEDGRLPSQLSFLALARRAVRPDLSGS